MNYWHLANLHTSVRLFLITFIFAAFAISVSAQGSTDGRTPLALERGAPAGSYPLSDFENVNLFNGGLNFSMPLMKVGSRGATSFPIMLRINQKWTVNKEINPGHSAFHFGHSTWWSEDEGPITFSIGGVRIRRGLLKNSGGILKSLTRITFTAPDGTEYELRDAATGGQPYSGYGLNRGKIFVSADGAAATYISDTDVVDGQYYDDDSAPYPANGYLLLRDGTRFRIEQNLITWLRDSNGNKVTFTYSSPYNALSSITDSLNRQITFTYGVTAGSETYDQISYKGFGGAPRTVKVGHAYRSQAMRSDLTAPSPLFPGLTGVDNSNPTVVNFIELPDGRRYQIQYNGYAEIARIVLPTGGAIEYDWAAGLSDGATSGLIQTGDWYVYRRVVERRVYPTGASGSSYETKSTYSRPESTTWNTGYIVVDQYNSSNTLLARTLHYFYGSAKASFDQKATDYAAWQDGKEYKTEVYASNGTTLLSKTDSTFEQRAAVSWWTGSSASAPPNDVRQTEMVSTIADANLVSKRTFGYDDSVPFNNKNNVKEYGFGTGAAGSLLRETRTTYETSSTYTAGTTGTSVHIRNLPTQVSIFNGSGAERARTTFEYDNYTSDSFHAGLVSRSNVSGFCAVVTSPTTCDNSNPTAVTTRGNRTGSTSYLLTNGTVTGSFSGYSQYDVLGNLVKTIDPRSTTSNVISATLEYDDRFGAPNGNAQTATTPSELSGLSSFAYATKITNAAGHISYSQVDYYIGRPVDGEDANGFVASGYYNDALERPTQIRRAVGTALQNQTTYTYDDTNRVITTSVDRDANNDNLLVSKLYYDQMGRTVETRQYEGGSNYITTQTQYDEQGRAYRTSNPYRPWQSESARWTTQAFDDLSRVISVTTSDSAVTSTSYYGNAATVSDEVGRQRKSITDALGRLVQVYEDPGGVNYSTTYTYDTLDNLIQVSQGSQSRYFKYDSLNRLLRSRSPEQSTYSGNALTDADTGNNDWSVAYQYDNNGNLTQKTDARGVVSSYTYDVLNRNTGVSYSNDPTGTLPITRVYDTATNGKGFLNQTQTTGAGGSRTTVSAFDALGRATSQSQQFYASGAWGTSYTTTPTYNMTGSVTALTYPSGHTISYSYDDAGRLTTFTGNLGVGGTAKNYATELLYSPFGGLTKEKFGTTTNTYNKSFYNSRGQLSEIRVSTSWTGPTDTTWNRGAIINHFSDTCWGMCGGSNSTTTMTDNNGNLQKQEIYIPSDDAVTDYHMKWQQFTYDSLNRLQWEREILNGGSEQWRQTYVYDRYGNRTIDASQSSGGVNEMQFTVDTSTNRLGVPSGQTGVMQYDAAGNLTNDTYSGAGNRTYDAENKLVSAMGGIQTSQAQLYSYDGNGNRVKRTVDGVETWQVYGLGGELLAEYSANGSATSPQREYGYRNGQLLIKAEAAATTNVTWTNTVGVSASGNNLTKTGATGWNAGAVSSQSIASGNGYVEFTASETASNRFCGLSNGDSDQSFYDIDFGLYLTGGGVAIYESGTLRGSFGAFSTGDVFQVKVEGGVVKYVKNGTVIYTSGVSPTYPLLVDTSMYDTGSTISNVKISTSGSTGGVEWIVADHLGTPRMVLDESGSLASVKRHDYLPFGEEIGPGISGRSSGQGYGGGDGVRQQFTSKERDLETGLDYFGARYSSSTQGRFTSADSLYIEVGRLGDPQRLNLYAYTRNNPLRFTDPTGHDIEVSGPLQDAYQQKLQESLSFKTQLNAKTHKVEIVDANGNALDAKQLKALGKTLKGAEKELFNAITDQSHHIKINAIDGAQDSNVFFGSSDGNHTGTHTIAFGQAALLDDPKNAGGMTSAQLVGHETLEGYAETKGSTLEEAHNYANGYFGGFSPASKSNANPTYGSQGGMVVQMTFNFNLHGSSTLERITMRFVTPVPQQDFLQGKGAPYRQYPVNVEAKK